jgi:hypothetical protein
MRGGSGHPGMGFRFDGGQLARELGDCRRAFVDAILILILRFISHYEE